MTDYQYINAYIKESTGVIELNRPKNLNSLNRQLIKEVLDQLEKFDEDSSIRVMIIKGNEQTFAAGADIDEMLNETPLSFELADPFKDWDRFMGINKPIIASVTGYALGGGFELALHCDLIVAAENSVFGFPEVNLGVMPGAGGTQLLTKIIGKRKALEWIWTGRQMPASIAHDLGIVNKIVAPEIVEEETFRLSDDIAKQPPIAVRLIKESVQKAEDSTLFEGMQLERKNFYLTFDSKDQKEGMQAFVEKRPPVFKGE